MTDENTNEKLFPSILSEKSSTISINSELLASDQLAKRQLTVGLLKGWSSITKELVEMLNLRPHPKPTE